MKNLIGMAAGVIAGLALFFTLFIGAILQNANYSLTGVVLEQTYEGYAAHNDYYLIEYEDGNIHEIEADDLVTGDHVTTWFYRSEPIRTIYTGKGE